jgi:tetratricopeptide (TPR) repeat protein
MSFSYFNVTRLISAISGVVVLLLCVSLPARSQPVDTEEIVIMFADFEGPDPLGIPVTETLYSWMLQVGNEEGLFRIIRLDEKIEIAETFETTMERALDDGADLVIWGVYDLPGTHVRIIVSAASCVGPHVGKVIRIPFDLEGSFPMSELAPGSEPPERIRALAYFLAGFTYLSRNDFEHGLEYLNKTLEYEDSAPIEMIATTYSLRSFVNSQWRRDALTALSDANRAIDMDPENPIHYSYRGGCYEMMGEIQAALDDYLIVNELTPSDPENLYNMSRLYQDLGDDDRAFDAINQAILLEPDSACYLNTRGYIYNNLGDYQAAVDDISRSLELNPEYPTGWANLGCAERELGNLSEAIRCFGNAIEYQDNTALISSYMLDRGYCFSQLQDYYSAIDDYTIALDLCPGTVGDYSRLGWLLMWAENYEDAVVQYDMALQIDSNNFEYLCRRGLCNYHIGETASSIEDLTTAYELDPDGFAIDDYLALGRAYREEGEYRSAISTFSRGLDVGFESIDRALLHYDRARCYRHDGDLESSLADLDEAIELHPSEPLYHYKRGEVCYLMYADDEAFESYNTALETGLEGDYLSACLFQRGRIFIGRENFDMAIQDMTAALDCDPRLFDAYFFRGLAYLYDGEFDTARENLERYIQVGTDPEYTASAREILRAME